jgi:hypothetical protein
MAWRSLIDLIGFGFQNRSCLDHPKPLEQCCGSICRTIEAPTAILADSTIVEVPLAAAISKSAGDEYTFNEPIIVYHYGLAGKSLTIKNLFHSDLRLTANSRDGLFSCCALREKLDRSLSQNGSTEMGD